MVEKRIALLYSWEMDTVEGYEACGPDGYMIVQVLHT
jgi:hypothetical protein